MVLKVHVVLVEPAGPLNVGSVARLCANFGIEGLRLVASRCDPLGEEARRMAVHAAPVLEAATRYATLGDALADCGRVVVTSGRQQGDPLPPVGAEEALRWLLAGDGEAPAALVFGREDRGLGNDELLRAGRVLRIATAAAYDSLNLSHAVAVVLHDLHRLRREPAGVVPGPGPGVDDRPADPPGWPEPCPRRELEGALGDAEDLLLEVGFLLPHTARARMAKLRALLQRAQVSRQEVALLRGMVCQLRWASRRPSPPDGAH